LFDRFAADLGLEGDRFAEADHGRLVPLSRIKCGYYGCSAARRASLNPHDIAWQRRGVDRKSTCARHLLEAVTKPEELSFAEGRTEKRQRDR
jgi:hypothetical protein